MKGCRAQIHTQKLCDPKPKPRWEHPQAARSQVNCFEIKKTEAPNKELAFPFQKGRGWQKAFS